MKLPAIVTISVLGTALVVLTLANYPGVSEKRSDHHGSVSADGESPNLAERLRDRFKKTIRRL